MQWVALACLAEGHHVTDITHCAVIEHVIDCIVGNLYLTTAREYAEALSEDTRRQQLVPDNLPLDPGVTF